MTAALFGAAIQGGIGVVALLVLYLSLRDVRAAVDRLSETMGDRMARLAILVGKTYGRVDQTPAFPASKPRRGGGGSGGSTGAGGSPFGGGGGQDNGGERSKGHEDEADELALASLGDEWKP